MACECSGVSCLAAGMCVMCSTGRSHLNTRRQDWKQDMGVCESMLQTASFLRKVLCLSSWEENHSWNYLLTIEPNGVWRSVGTAMSQCVSLQTLAAPWTSVMYAFLLISAEISLAPCGTPFKLAAPSWCNAQLEGCAACVLCFLLKLHSAVAYRFWVQLCIYVSVVWTSFRLSCFHMLSPLPTEACKKRWLSLITGLDLFLKWTFAVLTL